MAGTLTPTPYQTVLDADGVSVSGALIYTYTGGTTTPATTYTTSALSVANPNPIVADAAGRYVAYLPAGANMKFLFKTAAGATIEEQDNILSVPGAAVNLDIEGVVGVAVTAGQVCYLSAGLESPALTAGLWYLTDADFAVSSTTCQAIGVAVSAIPINTAGTIRLAGVVSTASAVVTGSTYYVSATAGALTTSVLALTRTVGVATTTSTLLLAATTAVVATIPNPIVQDLLFVDATYDIGKAGASRPRDLFQSRNATIGGTLLVTGATTLSSTVATGALTVTGNETVSGTLAVTGATTLTGGLNTPLVVAQGGSGVGTHTAYGVLTGGTTATGAEQTVTPGTAGLYLTSGGSAALPTWAQGKVVQIVSAITTTGLSSSTNAYATTGLTATITPTSASNRVLVFAVVAGCSKDSGITYIGLRLVRGATSIANMDQTAGNTGTTAANEIGACAINFNDGPGSTSATVYKIDFRNAANTGSVSVQNNSATSSIILMEVTP